MALLDRLEKIFTKKDLHQSMGMVTRNYVEGSKFAPQAQLRGLTYKIVDKFGQSVSVYEPQVQKPNGDIYANHPISVLASKPNPNMNSVDFHHLWAMLHKIYGETFWYLVRGESTNRVKELILLDPSKMQLKYYEGEVVGYILHKNNGDQVPFTLDEIKHDKTPNPFNQHRGMSVLERASIYVDTEITTANFTLSYMKNNASPSGIVQITEDMDREAFQQFASQWRENYEGPQNAGKTAFIRGSAASFTAVGATLKDVDQEITRKMAKEDVLMMFGMPKPLLGGADAQGLGRGNVDTLKYIFAESEIEPMMKRLDAIYEEIGESFGREGKVDVTHESPIPEDKEFELKQIQAGVNVWMTVNEVRALQGLESIPGGDEMQSNAPTVQLSVKDKKPEVIKVVKAGEDLAPPAEPEKDPEELRSEIVKTNEGFMMELKKEITRFATEQEKQVIANINASSKTFEEWLYNVKEQSEELASKIIPIITSLIKKQSAGVVNWLTGAKFEMTPELAKSVESRALRIAGLYNEETLKSLQATLAEGQSAGESLAKLKKRVEQTYSDAKGYRSERIARTESLRASNATAEEVYKQSGYTEVEWQVNPGACEFCLSMSGQTKAIGGTYRSLGDVITGTEGGQLQVAYENIDVPPLHPNCTCSLNPR